MIPDTALDQISRYQEASSVISDHGMSCCRRARAWLRGLDSIKSFRIGHWHPPLWLRAKFEWGPAVWPIHWCTIPRLDQLDCGGLAAVARELYRMRGNRVTGVQLALRYPNHAMEQWSRMWEREGVRPSWIHGEFCYHEACGVIEDGTVNLWDPTENRWLAPPSSPGNNFASVVAIRIAEPEAGESVVLAWDDLQLRCGRWQTLTFTGDGRLTAERG